MVRRILVALKFIAPALLLLLAAVAGHSTLSAASVAVKSAWFVLLFVLVVGSVQDSSRGRWRAYFLAFLFLIINAALFFQNSLIFMAWMVCAFHAAATVVLLSQVKTIRPLHIALVLISVIFAFMPSLLASRLLSADQEGYVIVTGAILSALWPVFFQYTFSFRADFSWPLLAIHQTLVRLGFLVWASQWKPVLLSTNLAESFSTVIVIILAGVFLLTNIFSSRISWAHVMQTVYSLLCILAVLFNMKGSGYLLHVAIGLLALGAIFMGDTSEDSREDRRLSYLELGGSGSGVFLLFIFVLFSLKKSLTVVEYVTATVVLFLVSAKVWTQERREDSIGKTEKTIELRKHIRFAVQITSWLTALYCIFYVTLE